MGMIRMIMYRSKYLINNLKINRVKIITVAIMLKVRSRLRMMR
jgi:hypothetical protein